VDGNHPNHVFQENGSASIGGSSGDNVVSFASAYPLSRQPLVFARSTSMHVAFQRWTFDGSGNVSGFKWGSVGGGSFNWVLVATPAAPSADDWGMRLYGPASELIFDSGLDYINIVDVVSLAISPFLTGNRTHAAATEAWYCITAAASWGRLVLGGAATRAFAAWKAINGTTVDLNWCTPDFFMGGGSAFHVPTTVPLIVADLG
jgi:hypothetical protein